MWLWAGCGWPCVGGCSVFRVGVSSGVCEANQKPSHVGLHSLRFAYETLTCLLFVAVLRHHKHNPSRYTHATHSGRRGISAVWIVLPNAHRRTCT